MSLPRLSVSSFILFATLAGSAGAQTLLFSDFSSTTGLSLNQADRVNSAILLASSNRDKRGAFFTTAAYNVSGFSAVFDFRISSPGGDSDVEGKAGADGIAFVIQRSASGSNALGGFGDGLGYAGIGSSIAVEFDTFKNSSLGDPNTNHLGIDANGSTASLATAVVGTPFDGGTKWTAWVDYDGTKLEVRVSQSGIRPEVAALTHTIDVVGTIGGPTAYIGFTGATGSAYGNHEILSLAFSDTYLSGGIAAVPEPSTYALLALGLALVGGAAWRRRRNC